MAEPENEFIVRSAGVGLRRHIHGYCGYAERSEGPARQRELPGAGVVLILGLGPDLKLLHPADPARAPVRLGSFLAGPDDASALVEHDGEMRGVQIDLTPLAARLLFRVPMHELARRTVPLDELLGQEARLLEERLADARDWNERFDLVEATLSARLEAAEPPPPDVEWAWRSLTSARGRVRIADLAAELGCSRKHLALRFREHVGLPPRLVVRLLRFRRAVDILLAAPQSTMAEVALACGYYDQAHLDRDFRDFAGTTPSAYAADARPPVTSVQDTLAAAS